MVTRPKPTAEVILATESGDPLLAWWRYGLGMSVAFTSDAKARWAAEWLTWPQFGQFWAQVVRHALRKAETKGTVVQVERKGRKAVVSLDAIEPSGKFLNRAADRADPGRPAARPRGSWRWPRSPRAGTRPSSTRPDRALTSSCSAQTKDGQLVGQQSRGLAVGYPDELRLRPTNTELLRSIAEITAGRNDAKAESVFEPTSADGPPGHAPLALPGSPRRPCSSCSTSPCGASTWSCC